MKKLFLVFAIFCGIATNAQTTLVNWNFDDSNTIADAGIPANATKPLTFNTLGTETYLPGVTGNCLSANKFNSGTAAKYWCMHISTAGYNNLLLSSQQSGTASGPRDFKIQYSTDSIAWVDVTGGNIVVAADWVSGTLTDLALPMACENIPDLYIRWIMTSDIQIDGVGNVAWNSKAYIENIIVKGTQLVLNDANSQLSAGSAVEPTSINSTINTQTAALQVFDITFTDAQAGDALPTIINSLTITQGTSNQITDWATTIAGAELTGIDGTFTGTISPTGISFSPAGGISVAEGTPETYALKIWLLPSLPANSDNSAFDFSLSFTDISCSSAGSSFGVGTIGSGAIAIKILATQLLFSQTPATVSINANFSVSILATDSNGNIDTDFTNPVTLSLGTGTGIFSSATTLSANAVSGIANWTDLLYDTEENFSITANTTGLSTVTSTQINAQNILTCLNADFEDGLLTGWQESIANHWAASTTNPLNGNISLHHIYNNPTAGTDMIAYPLCDLDFIGDTVFWQFQIKHTQAPSSSNNWAVFLTADADATQMKPTGNINGYILGVDFTGSDDTCRLWKVTAGVATEVINTGINWQNNPGTTSQAGFKIYRTPTGEWSVYSDINGGFDNLVLSGTKTVSTELFNPNFFGIYYEYSSAADMKLWADDINIHGKQGVNRNSTLTNGIAIEPTEISSILDTQPEAIEALDFKISDAATGDQLPTSLLSVAFTQGNLNSVQDWTQAIAGATLSGTGISIPVSGVVGNDSIKFTFPAEINIPDGTFADFSLKIWLKTDLSQISDNQKLDFSLSTNGILTNPLNSQLSSNTLTSGSENISIIGTLMKFIAQPTTIPLNYNFATSINIQDENGNKDTDFSEIITLSRQYGTGNLTSASNNLSQTTQNGVFNWVDLQYNTSEKFTIQATCTSLSPIISDTIIVENITVYIDDNQDTVAFSGWNNTQDWIKSDISPISGTHSLKHNLSNVSGASYIYRSLNGLPLSDGKTTWKFNLKNGNWSPSSSNKFWFYLATDTPDFTSPTLNGYAIGVNQLDDSDNLILTKISNGVATALINTNFTWANGALTGIEITRSASGVWEINYDADGNFNNLTQGGAAVDNSFTNAMYCGLYFKFSTTRAGELWFDDLYVTGAPDTHPPIIQSIIANTPNIVQVTFNEPVTSISSNKITNFIINNAIGNPASISSLNQENSSVSLTLANSLLSGVENTLTINNLEDSNGNITTTQEGLFSYSMVEVVSAIPLSSTEIDLYFTKNISPTTVSNLQNYLVDNQIGNPISANLDVSNSKLIHLTYSTNFTQAQTYSIAIKDIEDTFGNLILPTTFQFFYYVPKEFDVVINEIMFDISPLPQGLPAAKYLEIKNNSDYELNLSGWQLTVGTNTSINFPATKLPAGSYAIICPDASALQFAAYGITIPILSESQLTTTGKQIKITSNTGIVIEDISYTPDWYNNPNRKNGGWSIERIDPTNFCGKIENWKATEDYFGGTPGRINTVFASNPDITPPTLVEINTSNSKNINLVFSEEISNLTAQVPNNYLLNGIQTPILASKNTVNNTEISVQFTDNLIFGTNNIAISNLQDNCGNVISATNMSFIYKQLYPISVEVKSSTEIKVYFSEDIDVSSAQNTANYLVSKNINSPFAAVVNADKPTVANLTFTTPFTLGETYDISIKNIYDKNANLSADANLSFVYYIPKPFDIVFTEIMVDINPAPAGLPEAQYVELKNISPYPITLTDWKFVSENQTQKKFPYLQIPSGGYAVICEPNFEMQFKTIGTGIVAGILGSSDLSNSGKNLKLLSLNDEIIAEITYSNQWYNNPDHSNGGWALEAIDPTNLCEPNKNWSASESVNGGTPGAQNSINNANIDISAPEVVKIKVISSNSIQIEFNEPLSKTSISTLTNFSADNNLNNPTLAVADIFNKNVVTLQFSSMFTDGILNTITLANLQDNCGNIMPDIQQEFTYHLLNIVSAWVVSPNSLKLLFSEPVNETVAETTANYSVDNAIGNPQLAVRDVQNLNIVYLQFATNFTTGTLSTLTIENISDINSNLMPTTTIQFEYYLPQANDIVINEVLFNPLPTGTDFVEIYNRSNHNFNLKDFQVSNRNADGILGTAYNLSDIDFTLAPGEYLTLTADSNLLINTYINTKSERILSLKTMPSFPDDLGTVVILYNQTTVIDEFSYNKSMHFPLIDSEEGVSLERINYDNPTIDNSNWHSAAADVGYATPGYKNSQYQEIGVSQANSISVTPEIFSPDNDGFEDFTTLNYAFNQPGYTANIYVYTGKGYMINQIANNMLLATSGSILWDGLDAEKNKVNAGIYVLYIEIFDLSGKIQKYKKVVTVATKL